MTKVEEQLTAIGFGKNRTESCCWRALRLDAPNRKLPQAETGPEPACSAALLRWRDLLARGARPSPYRISRV